MIARGSLWWADLGQPEGSEPGRRRPVLVVQSKQFNRSALATCVVVSLTSNTALAEYPGNVFVPGTATPLERDSVVNVTQIATVNRSVLASEIGALPMYLMEEVTRGLRLVLDV